MDHIAQQNILTGIIYLQFIIILSMNGFYAICEGTNYNRNM